MKNRKYLRSMSMYDLLVMINDSLLSRQHGICILDSFMSEDDTLDRCGDMIACDKAGFKDKCRKCIAAFMEEEHQ